VRTAYVEVGDSPRASLPEPGSALTRLAVGARRHHVAAQFRRRLDHTGMRTVTAVPAPRRLSDGHQPAVQFGEPRHQRIAKAGAHGFCRWADLLEGGRILARICSDATPVSATVSSMSSPWASRVTTTERPRRELSALGDQV